MVETVDRRNEADDAVGYQIVQIYVRRQATVNFAGQQADLRQMFQNQTLTLFI